MNPPDDIEKQIHASRFTLIRNPHSATDGTVSVDDLAALELAVPSLTRRRYGMMLSRIDQHLLCRLASKIQARLWVAGHGCVLSARKHDAVLGLRQPDGEVRWQHTTHTLLTVSQRAHDPVFLTPVAEWLRLHRDTPPPGPHALWDRFRSASGPSSETVGSVLCGLFERSGQDVFPAPSGTKALFALRAGMNYHRVTENLRADALTFVGFSASELNDADRVVRMAAATWSRGLIAHSFHIGFASAVSGHEFTPLGSPRPLTVKEPIGRLGHQKTKGPFVVLATRTIRDHPTPGFSRAFAIPVVSVDCVLPCESNNERLVEGTAARVVAEPVWSSGDNAHIKKRLFGRGHLGDGNCEIVDDPDRIDLDIHFRGVVLEEETMGYTTLDYRWPKLEMIRARAQLRALFIVDLSEASTDEARNRVLREFAVRLRRLFLDIRRLGHLPPGLHAIVPAGSWFSAQINGGSHPPDSRRAGSAPP